MKSHLDYFKLALRLLVSYSALFAASTQGQEILSKSEVAVFHPLPQTPLMPTATFRMNLEELVCLDRVELVVQPTQAVGTLFLMAGEGFNPEPLDQDLHVGTVVVSPLPNNAPQSLRFRVGRMTRQSFLLAGGAGVRVLSARSVIVPDERCPGRANLKAVTWLKVGSKASLVVEEQLASPESRIFTHALKAALRTLDLALNSKSLVEVTKPGNPDTWPQVRRASLALACIISDSGETLATYVPSSSLLYTSGLSPLLKIREAVFEAYNESTESACGGQP